MKIITKYVGDSGQEYATKYDAMLDDCLKFADVISEEMANITYENETRITARLLAGMAKQPRKAYRRLLKLRSLRQAADRELPETHVCDLAVDGRPD